MDDMVKLPEGIKHPMDCTIEELANTCERLNAAYRAGRPLVPDEVYDHLFVATLAERAPDHPFLHQVEPEGDAFSGESVEHESPMLSTNKAYTADELRLFVNRVASAAESLGFGLEDMTFRMTPKLDGIAGMLRSDGRLVTRGNGLAGTDITHAFDRGLRTPGDDRSPGAGELVLDELFFREAIAETFDMAHPRNFIAGFVAADVAKEHHVRAAEAGAMMFFPYDQLPSWQGSADDLLENWEQHMASLRRAVPYRTDGAVLEVTEQVVREAMGATSSFHRWQIALKTKGETATTRVHNIRLQTGRTGRITPVMEIEPVTLSGAVISNVTAHTAANLAQQGLGEGAEVEITRAGDVIPKLERVVTAAAKPMAVSHCPSCGHAVEVEGEYAVCPNAAGCPAQAESRIRHFFQTMGNADLFGPRTVAVLVEQGYTDVRSVFDLTAADFGAMGFGPGQSANLERELTRCRREAVPDWRFLAAIGLRHLGRGDARKLLSMFSLDEVTDLTAEAIAGVEGFGAITSRSIADQLQEQKALIEDLRALGFNLRPTPKAEAGADAPEGPLSGEAVVFTGTLTSGTRGELEEQARNLGATVQSSVNSKTTILVCGEKAGSKRKKAEGINEKAGKEQVRILEESDWAGWLQQAEA